ncbi:hypothetical protein OPKNFCMD_5262 [Methylobacterium crusticola]|uniref:Uncharacterized protein n=1 Tax=Methylobacterium crusticola TaxID=1697972 RepID=A0ABQ4R5A5_9HYPH|nr:hypothetical protein [Methylobacterium crusticola]GJD52496.1 hypothetical protein OPKNFCMD_5262 [Methylobacterium crusticola]
MDRPRSVGMPWYRAQDYSRLLEVMEDADRLPGSHEAWRLSAEQVEGEVKRSGVAVVRVVIEPDGFVAWCTAHGLRANAASRARFANESAADPGLAAAARP